MSEERFKPLIPYAVIPVLWLALFHFRRGEADPVLLLWQELIITFGYIAAYADIKSKIIPNNLILVMFGAWLITTILTLFINPGDAFLLLKDALLGCAIGGLIFLFVYITSGKGLGGGDVKFMAAAGLYLGFGGTISALLCGTVLAAVTGLLLLLQKKITRRDSIPLAPFLYAGILITVFISG